MIGVGDVVSRLGKGGNLRHKEHNEKKGGKKIGEPAERLI